MEIFILGSGGMMPLPYRHLASALVRREGESFLFDCGEGTQIAIKKHNLRWKSISTIFITHTHADHVTGLPGLLMLTSQVERTEPLLIVGPPRIAEYIEASRRTLDMHINYPITVHEIEDLRAINVVYENDFLKVKSFPVFHSRPCVGYALEEKLRPGRFYPEKAIALNVPAGPLWSKLQHGKSVVNDDGREVVPAQVLGVRRKGRKFCYITDTLYHRSLATHVEGADLFICEGMFANEFADSAREKKHMTAEEAAHIAHEAGSVSRLGLTHFSPRYTKQDLKNLLDEAQNVFPETFLCHDRLIVEIPQKEDEGAGPQ